MFKKLFVWHFNALLLLVGLCSFVFFGNEKDLDLEKNELSYSDTKIQLNFGGLEELNLRDESECFRTDIYLSDLDLNNAGINSREQIVLVLKNHMFANEFINGVFSVSQSSKTGQSIVVADLFTLNGKPSKVEIVSGIVQYEGAYPQVQLTFDLLLSNGERLKGSYFKEMQSFKYYF